MKLFATNSNNKIQGLSYWTTFAKNKKKLIVFYGEDVLDLTDFASIHPAGEKALSSYLLQDVKNIIFRVYPHPSNTVDVLKKYICGKIKDYKQITSEITHKGICKQKSNLPVKKQQQNKKVSFDDSKQNNLKALKTPLQKPKSTQNLLRSSKMEENVSNFQQNKPTLMVPHFYAKLDCFSRDLPKFNKQPDPV